jgi:hypothetical protein
MIIKYLLIIFMIVSFPATLLSQEEEEEEENPHVEMIDDEFVCLDCHTDIPKKGQTSPTYFLVDNPSENCLGCHDETQHAGAKEHEGQKAEHLPGDENGNIACFTCHDPHPGGVIEGRTVYDAELSERSKQFIEFIVVPNLTEELGHEVKPEFMVTEVYLREPSNKICITCHEAPIKKDWRNHPPWYKFTDMYTY